MREAPILLAVVATLALFIFAGFVQVSVWNECRETNSFFYCMRLVSK